MISDPEQFKIRKLEEVKKLEKRLKKSLSHEALLSFAIGYDLAASYWHQRGLTEGWNDHIEQLSEIMEKVGGKGTC